MLINENDHGEIAIPTSWRNARIGRTHHSIVITTNMMIVRILGLFGHFLMFRAAINVLIYTHIERTF